MPTCDVCGNTEFHNDYVEEVFRVENHRILVEHIPARVCDRCGDATFDCETVEQVRRMVHEGSQPIRHEDLEVFALA